MKFFKIVFILFFIHFYLFGAFYDYNFSARSKAIAETSVVDECDINSVIINPAIVTNFKKPVLCVNYNIPFISILPDGQVIHQMSLVGATNIYRDLYVAFSVLNANFVDIYSEDLIGITIGYQSKPYISIGGTINYLRQKFMLGNIEFYEDYKELDEKYLKERYFMNGAFLFDLGVFLKFKKIKFGTAIKNINQPTIGIDKTDYIPLEIIFGCQHEPLSFIKTYLSYRYRFQNWDYQTRSKNIDFRLGTIFKVNQFEFLFGISQFGFSCGIGSEIKFKNFFTIFYYSTIYSFDLKGIYTQNFSFVFKL